MIQNISFQRTYESTEEPNKHLLRLPTEIWKHIFSFVHGTFRVVLLKKEPQNDQEAVQFLKIDNVIFFGDDWQKSALSVLRIAHTCRLFTVYTEHEVSLLKNGHQFIKSANEYLKEVERRLPPILPTLPVARELLETFEAACERNRQAERAEFIKSLKITIPESTFKIRPIDYSKLLMPNPKIEHPNLEKSRWCSIQ